MQITITIPDNELQKACEDRVRLIVAEHIRSYAYQSIVRDQVSRAIHDETINIIKTSVSNMESLKAIVMSEIERKIRMNVAREISKKGET